MINFILSCDTNNGSTNSDKDEQIKQKNSEIAGLNSKITELENKLTQASIGNKDEQIKQKDSEIAGLNSKIKNLEAKLVIAEAENPKTKQKQAFEQAIAKVKQYKDNLNVRVDSDIFGDIQFSKNDITKAKIKYGGQFTDAASTKFTDMAADILEELFSEADSLVKKKVNSQNTAIDDIIKKDIIELINVKIGQENYDKDLQSFYFKSGYYPKNTTNEEAQAIYIRGDLISLLNSKKLWMQRLKDYIEAAIDAGKKSSPPQPFIKWENIE